MDVKKSKNESAHLNEHQAALYVDYFLNNQSRKPSEEILSHVENCPVCKDYIMDVFLFINNAPPKPKSIPFQSWYPELERYEASRKNHHYLKRIAASFFIMGLMITFYFTIVNKQFFKTSTERRDNDTIISDKNKQSSIPPYQQAAPSKSDKKSNRPIINKDIVQNQNFKINPNLEYMVNSQLRDETIKVNSPINNSIVENNITFSWNPFTQQNVHLKILNNTNSVMFEFTVKQNTFVLRENLPPGLYYWKLENQTDLLYVGKFFIRNNTNDPTR